MGHQKIKPVTEAEWLECHEWNRMIITEFLQQSHLSPHTRKQYKSALYIFARYVKENMMNKPIYDLKVRDALKYQNYLDDLELSSSAVRFKRSAVSSLSNFIELYYGEDFPKFRQIFNKAIPSPSKNIIHEKIPLTKDEFEFLIETLREQNELQMIAYILFSYYSGARRSEVVQLKKEIVGYEQVKDEMSGESLGYYQTHLLRTKGKSKVGNIRRLDFNEIARKAVEDWLIFRGDDDCESVFVKKTKDGKVTPLNPEAFNGWCTNKFSKIIGKRLTPHNFRRTRATHLVVHEGKDISVAQDLLGHQSSETTSIYVINPNANNVRGAFE